MSSGDMAAEQKRVGRLRRLLEPLAVLYEKAVLEACKDPFEVRFVIHTGVDYPREESHGAEPVHIINGEPLQAAYEVWQEYRRTEREQLEQAEPPVSDNEGEQLPDGLNSLSAPERAWLEWFYSLSDVDRKIVERCGEKDISVTPANIDQMKKS